MNIPDNVFENPYEEGQYLHFTMNVPTAVNHLIATLEVYRTFVISEDLQMVVSELAENGEKYEATDLAEIFSIHDVLANFFGHYGDLDIDSVWYGYVKDFTTKIKQAEIKEAGLVIFKSYCFRAFKAKSIEEEWGDAVNI